MPGLGRAFAVGSGSAWSGLGVVVVEGEVGSGYSDVVESESEEGVASARDRHRPRIH